MNRLNFTFKGFREFGLVTLDRVFLFCISSIRRASLPLAHQMGRRVWFVHVPSGRVFHYGKGVFCFPEMLEMKQVVYLLLLPPFLLTSCLLTRSPIRRMQVQVGVITAILTASNDCPTSFARLLLMTNSLGTRSWSTSVSAVFPDLHDSWPVLF